MGFWSDPIGNTIKAVKEAVTGGGSSSSSTSGSSSRKDTKVSGRQLQLQQTWNDYGQRRQPSYRRHELVASG
jgi:hypothetical protein